MLRMFDRARPGAQLVVSPLLVAVEEEGSEEAGVEMVQDGRQQVLVKLKCVGELLGHLEVCKMQFTLVLLIAMRRGGYIPYYCSPATRSLSTGGRLGSALSRCVCPPRGRSCCRTCARNSATPSLSAP